MADACQGSLHHMFAGGRQGRNCSQKEEQQQWTGECEDCLARQWQGNLHPGQKLQVFHGCAAGGGVKQAQCSHWESSRQADGSASGIDDIKHALLIM